jgi:uncharacterized protein
MNNREQTTITDEQLNAYIDDELEFEERKRVFHLLEEDEVLTHEAQELRQLRAMLQNAYRTPPTPSAKDPIRRSSRGTLVKSVAAGLLVAIGTLLGWYGNQEFIGETRHMALQAEDAQFSLAINGQTNLLLHLSSGDPARMDAALSYAERLLAKHKQQGKPFKLEVVVNDGGVKLLRKGTSPFPQRIKVLLGKYDNVSFLACASALQKLRDRGVKVELLPGIHSDKTILEEIVKRLEGGWRYLKI